MCGVGHCAKIWEAFRVHQRVSLVIMIGALAVILAVVLSLMPIVIQSDMAVAKVAKAGRDAIDGAFQQTSIGTGGFTLDKVEIADDCQLVTPGKAFKKVLTEINGARAYVAAMCNAMLRAAITEAPSFGARRARLDAML